jgi:hypothetical protein
VAAAVEEPERVMVTTAVAEGGTMYTGADSATTAAGALLEEVLPVKGVVVLAGAEAEPDVLQAVSAAAAINIPRIRPSSRSPALELIHAPPVDVFSERSDVETACWRPQYVMRVTVEHW